MTKPILITGSGGLVGSETAKYFLSRGFDIIGVDNDSRKSFFGPEASVKPIINELTKYRNYHHLDFDLTDAETVQQTIKAIRPLAIIHCAAQPSHDWAKTDPHRDFQVNANATLNLLEAARHNTPDAPFIYTSTNKVYGDRPNFLPRIERKTRYEITGNYTNGIDETMSLDQTTHSLFGVSKTAADLLVQEYGRYFNMPTVCFRAGCITGKAHRGASLHGFLSYLIQCAMNSKTYTIFGYQGKQVRDNIHAEDLARAFYQFYTTPTASAVYNIGGGLISNCSIIEAINLIEDILGHRTQTIYDPTARVGDHIWYISDVSRFKTQYPAWEQHYNMRDIITEYLDQGEQLS